MNADDNIMKYIILSAILFLLAACGAGPHAVASGTAVEYINNIEVRQNGQYDIWLDNDPSTDYCTFDKALYQQATQLANTHQLVILNYNGINTGDKDQSNILTGAGCELDDKVTTLRLISISAIPH